MPTIQNSNEQPIFLFLLVGKTTINKQEINLFVSGKTHRPNVGLGSRYSVRFAIVASLA